MLDIVKRNTQASSFAVLPKRWIVERTFAVRDFERLPQPAEAFIFIAMVRIMIRRLAKL